MCVCACACLCFLVCICVVVVPGNEPIALFAVSIQCVSWAHVRTIIPLVHTNTFYVVYLPGRLISNAVNACWLAQYWLLTVSHSLWRNVHSEYWTQFNFCRSGYH